MSSSVKSNSPRGIQNLLVDGDWPPVLSLALFRSPSPTAARKRAELFFLSSCGAVWCWAGAADPAPHGTATRYILYKKRPWGRQSSIEKVPGGDCLYRP